MSYTKSGHGHGGLHLAYLGISRLILELRDCVAYLEILRRLAYLGILRRVCGSHPSHDERRYGHGARPVPSERYHPILTTGQTKPPFSLRPAGRTGFCAALG